MEYTGVGSIKKIFGRQREPYGFVNIHHPAEVKGMEAVFYLKDVLVNEDERRLLQGGLIVRFMFSRKPLDRMKAPCPFKATQVRVQDPMEYNGTVARSAQGALVIFVDVLFRQVRVPLLAQSASAGDRCVVSISWKQMVRALRKNRDPVGQLVAVDRRPGVLKAPPLARKCSPDLRDAASPPLANARSSLGSSPPESSDEAPTASPNRLKRLNSGHGHAMYGNSTSAENNGNGNASSGTKNKLKKNNRNNNNNNINENVDVNNDADEDDDDDDDEVFEEANDSEVRSVAPLAKRTRKGSDKGSSSSSGGGAGIYQQHKPQQQPQPQQHQKQQQPQPQLQKQNMWTTESELLQLKLSLLGNGSSYGLMGSPIWSTDLSSLHVKSDHRRSNWDVLTSMAGPIEDIQLDPLGGTRNGTRGAGGGSGSGGSGGGAGGGGEGGGCAVGSASSTHTHWSDSDWHMQTVRIAEMALPGRR